MKDRDRYAVLDDSGLPSDFLRCSVTRAFEGLDFVVDWGIESCTDVTLVLRFFVNGAMDAERSELLEIVTTEIISDFGAIPRVIDHVLAIRRD